MEEELDRKESWIGRGAGSWLSSDSVGSFFTIPETLDYPRRAEEVLMRRFFHPLFPLFFWAACGVFPGLLQAQGLEPPSPEAVQDARNAPLFTSHETLQMTLEADFSAMKRNDRGQDSEERPGVLRWTSASGVRDSLEIQIETRGNFRLQRKNCEFPPLRLNLKKKATKGTIFDGQDKLKLVVTCKLGRDYWEQYVLLEYLAYRTFNLITDKSFRVRLARVTYVDTSGRDDPFTRYGIILEDDDTMALRHEGRKVDWTSGQLDPRHLDPYHAVLVDVFQYMIGNTDWSGVEMHNMELIETTEREYFTIPYDFDFSGVVNARYAAPDPSLPIRRVRQRLFRGFCPDQVNRPQETYEQAFGRFLELKDEIYELWMDQEGLERDRLEETLEYFDDFYQTVEEPDRIESRMFDSCRRIRG